jgi:FkbM family methyltransferase
MLQPVVKNKNVNNKVFALIPPHDSYSDPTYRLARKDSLRLYANLYDYNDWKAYWNLKETERELLYGLAKDCKNVIDVGANNGWVLMNIATIVTLNNGFVYGFEPHPETYKRCIRNIEASNIKNCIVYNMGCGEMSSELLMTSVKASNSGQNRIIDENEVAENTVRIKIVKLDEQLANIEQIDLIKIDVEGFEMHVLKGANKILTRFRPKLFIEIDDVLLRSNNTSPKEIFNYLKDNYNYNILNASNNKPLNANTEFDNCHLDIVCISQS